KGPEIYVPSAFTPNGDGKNDILRALPAGVQQFLYFRVYNRWGQLVFQTQDHRIGWDGKINGQIPPTGTFVWVAEGIDYLGQRILRKGTVVLIR
ncbi:MAG: gliding motility-associated C-terminal domain-containing protein, partial [Chitinophagaceae bacterium]|nr:gliding motility-associated C-terminal domain-containing protein [Chitinophagaceae bacterium]